MSVLVLVLLAAAAAATFAWIVPLLAARTDRPGFVVGIVLAASAAAVFEIAAAVAGGAGAERFVLGVWVTGREARLVGVVHAVTCAVIALGLWRMRPWARWLAMIALGYLIATFLIWGVRGGRADVGAVMLWQMLVLPFLTFGFMYLQRGGRYFRRH